MIKYIVTPFIIVALLISYVAIFGPFERTNIIENIKVACETNFRTEDERSRCQLTLMVEHIQNSKESAIRNAYNMSR